MLLHWSDIAIEQERLACAARRFLESDVQEAAAAGKAIDLNRELHPSLIAIAAVTHALDALYGELRDVALPADTAARWRENPRSGPRRWRQVHETLKHGFEISAQRWEAELETLFDLRDGAVHPELVFRESEPHPLGVSSAVEHVTYRREKAPRPLICSSRSSRRAPADQSPPSNSGRAIFGLRSSASAKHGARATPNPTGRAGSRTPRAAAMRPCLHCRA